jgi:hypothetical protein
MMIATWAGQDAASPASASCNCDLGTTVVVGIATVQT